MERKIVKPIWRVWMVILAMGVFLLASCSSEEEDTKVVNNQIVVPSLLEVEPTDNAEEVPLNQSIVLVFSEEMNESSMTTNSEDTTCQGSVQVSDDDFETCLQVAKTETSTDDSNRYSYELKPTSLMNAQTTYKVKVTTDLKSIDNIALLSDYTTPNGFTTGEDVTVPVVMSTTPVDESVQVGVASSIVFEFSEAMDIDSFTSESVRVTNGNGDQLPGIFTASGSTVEYIPDTRFSSSTTYVVTLGTDITSASGQNPDSEFVFSFTTGPIDVVVDYEAENTTESGVSRTFTVNLSCEPTDDVSLSLASSDISEGIVSPTSLVFTPADWAIPQTVTITGVDDALYDGSAAYSINFQAAVSDDPRYNGFEPVDILLYNHDNDLIGTQTSKIVANDGINDDRFGSSVSLGMEYAVVGAPYTDDAALSSGSAYVFRRNSENGSWLQVQELVADDAGASDYFGGAVAISGDHIVVGARYDDESGSNAGAVYFFRRNGNSWEFQTKATAAGGYAGDYLGGAVSIDGDYAAIGAIGRDDNGSTSGAVYIFKRNSVSGSWFQVDQLLAADGAESDQFGYSVAIDGAFIIVGAPYDDDTAAGSGSVYVFKKDSGLDTWSQVSKVTAADPAADDRLGWSVDISGDYALAGSPLDDGVATNTGSAMVIKRDSGYDTWSRDTKLTASDTMANDQFGGSVAIYDDYIAVGARYEDNANGSNAGAVYLFQRDTGDGSWDPLSKIVAIDGLANDQLGYAVSLFGGNILSGAYLNNNENGYYAGAAFFFR